MNKKQVQCYLQTMDGVYFHSKVVWLPEKYAVEGKSLQFKNKNTGEWGANWDVVAVYETTKLDEDWIRDVTSQQHKNMRKMTDI